MEAARTRGYEPGVIGDHPAGDEDVGCEFVGAAPSNWAEDQQIIDRGKRAADWFDNLNP